VLAGHRLDLDVSPDLPFVVVDPQLFHHCLINLLENAAKYGDADGAIRITAQRRHDGIVLHVMDEGPGLPPGGTTRLFETFTRIEGSDRKGGTGLGLAIVKGFAEAMGLSVAAANRADRPGACFSICFPEDRIRKGRTSE
jgi:two-component system sensor histidine kinase KdpD